MGRMLTSKALRPQTAPLGAQPSAVFAAPVKQLPVPAAIAAAEPAQDKVERQNHLRKIAFFASLCFLFLRVTDLSNLLLYLTHINFYLLYLVSPLAIIGTLTTGGIGRTLRSNASKYWLAFFLWMVIGTPFSTWRGDSVALVTGYGRFQLATLFVIAGLAMTWPEIRLLFNTLALSAVTTLFITKFFGKLDAEGRINMNDTQAMGNSNDLGALLLLLTPFLLYVFLDRKRTVFLRVLSLPFIAYSAYVVLGTGSRGCLIAMIAMFVFGLVRASTAQRAGIFIAGVALAVILPLALPGGL